MDILTFGECFPDVPGKSIFTIVVFKKNDQTYSARLNDRCASKADITPERLEDVVKIEKSAFQPEYEAQYTRAEHMDQLYVKRPNLLSYYPIDQTSMRRIANEVLQEVQACEIFRTRPHPNIAEYVGCEVDNGRISGICFKQYTQSLHQRLNPRHLNKREFARNSRLDAGWCRNIIEGIKKGLDHIHALDLVHNDLNPSNVMLDERDTPIIIDFGSCRSNGESIEDVGRTYEWFDDGIHTVSPNNDLDALAEMEAWMFGKSDNFKFSE